MGHQPARSGNAPQAIQSSCTGRTLFPGFELLLPESLTRWRDGRHRLKLPNSTLIRSGEQEDVCAFSAQTFYGENTKRRIRARGDLPRDGCLTLGPVSGGVLRTYFERPALAGYEEPPVRRKTGLQPAGELSPPAAPAASCRRRQKTGGAA